MDELNKEEEDEIAGNKYHFNAKRRNLLTDILRI